MPALDDGVVVRSLRYPELSVYLIANDVIDNETLRTELLVQSIHGSSWSVPLPHFTIKPQPVAYNHKGISLFAYWSGKDINVCSFDQREGTACTCWTETAQTNPLPDGTLHGFRYNGMAVIIKALEGGELSVVQFVD